MHIFFKIKTKTNILLTENTVGKMKNWRKYDMNE